VKFLTANLLSKDNRPEGKRQVGCLYGWYFTEGKKPADKDYISGLLQSMGDQQT
jgi:hypothetical protein